MSNADLGSYLSEMSRRMDATKPKLVTGSTSYRNRQVAAEVLPEGYTVSPMMKKRADMANWGGQSTMSGGMGGNSSMHTMRPYMPEFDSPDRQWYPDNRLEANHYWRLFYKYDPFFGTAVDMYSGMMTSDFDIVLENDTDTSIQTQLNYMCEKTRFLDKFQSMVKEFLVVGECFPHCFFDKEQGIWSYIAFHNPDYIEVQDSPIIDMEPILNFIPDEALRDFLTSNTPESIEIRNRLPSEFVSKVLARQKIRLSPLNCSFVPRLLHPYDERGVSLASRLWRIWMVEDAVYSSTIASFRRAACFVAGTRILTSKGIKPIEEIQVGDTVVSGEGYLKKVEAAWEDHTDELVEIRTAGSEILRCTPNHRFKLWVRPRLCSCGCGQELGNTSPGTPRTYITNHCETKRDPSTGRLIKSAQTWKQLSVEPNVRVLEGYEPIQTLNAEDIRRSDYLLIPRKFEQIPMEVTSKDLSMARLLGYYVAEGSKVSLRSSKNTGLYGIGLSFSLAEFDTWAKDIEDIGEELGVHVRSYQYSVNDGIREGGTNVCISHVADLWLSSWCIEHGGEYSGSKTLSETVMSWPIEMKKQFIIGLFRGDGHSRKDEEAVHYATTSPSLAYQVRLILAQMGVLGSVSVSVRKQEKWNDVYNVISCGNGGRYLSKLVWDKDLVYKGSRVTHAWHWMDEDYIYVKVLKVTKVKETCSVYNMTVEGDHSYIANGIATRNSPLKVIKQGDANTGWIPDPSTESELLRMLAQAELDPHAYLVTHYGVNFEMWGGSERAITLSRENDTIEKVKLMALGLSKSFMSGEVTFASAKSGLQVFLRRLLSMRQFFEQSWILPKFFAPIVEINDWVKSTPAEVNNRIKVKRTAQEAAERGLMITPKIKWRNKLDPTVDAEVLTAYSQLKNFGFDISQSSVGSAVSLNWEDELRKKAVEFKIREGILSETLGETLKQKFEQAQQAGAKPPGGAGGGAMPPGAAGGAPGGAGAKPKQEPGGKPVSNPPGSADSNGAGSDGIEGPGSVGIA